MRFSVFDRIFVVVLVVVFFFAVLRMIFFLRFHGFLFCKLKISLSKITDLPFRSVPCLKIE